MTRFTRAAAALIAALAIAGAPAPASAASSSVGTQLAAAFPVHAFLLKNPSQSARCATFPATTYVGSLTLQTCDYRSEQYVWAFVYEGITYLTPLYGPQGGEGRCLFDTGTKVYSNSCTFSVYTEWQVVGATVRNVQTGKCLSANSAGEIYPYTCDGAINRNWEFIRTIPDDELSGAISTTREALSAKLAAAAR